MFHPKSRNWRRNFRNCIFWKLSVKEEWARSIKPGKKSLDRVVALKILPPGIGDDAAFAGRFAQEARALAKLNHPGIVTIYDFGRADGLYFFLMEFVDGVNLRQLLANGRVSPREALAIVPQICDALQYAHDQGIVHRDVKPENLLLDRQGRVKVADFGLAKLIGAPPTSPADAGILGATPSNLTEGRAIGTPQYMAPEQLEKPQEVDHRADIFSLGVVFYELLTGQLPAGNFAPPSRKVTIDARLDEVVLRALEKEPELRYQQAKEVKTKIDTITSTPPVPSSDTANRRTFAWLSFGFLLAGILGCPLLIAFNAYDGAVLTFGGLTLALAFIFGLVSWRERLGRIVALVVSGLVLLPAVSIPVVYEVKRTSHANQARAQEASARRQLLQSLQANEALLERNSTTNNVLVQKNLQAIEKVREELIRLEGVPEVESVVVSKDRAVVKERSFHGEGMIITFGDITNRWQAGSPYLDSMFDITLESGWFAHGVNWVVKLRHGPNWSYRLDGPFGSMLGKIVFQAGTPAPEADGSYVIGEFQPETGAPLPIAARLIKDDSGKSSQTKAMVNFDDTNSTDMERDTEVIRIRLRHAQSELARLTQLSAGAISEEDLQEAKDKVELLKVQLDGNKTNVTRVKLAAAQRTLDRLTILWSTGQITREEVEEARGKVEILKAEMAGDPVRVAEVKLNVAQRALDAASQQYRMGLGVKSAVEDAQAEVDVLKEELKAAQAAQSRRTNSLK